jgi:hypothetical protein
LIKNGGGNARLNSGLTQGDPVLKKELVNYNMKCTDTRPLICVLFPNKIAHLGALKRFNLDLTNIRNTSPQLYKQLYSRLVGQYVLGCGPIVNVNRGDTGRGNVVR